jgi:hypothetical protein
MPFSSIAISVRPFQESFDASARLEHTPPPRRKTGKRDERPGGKGPYITK